MSKEQERAPNPWKPALIAFSVLLFATLIFLKPYLPRAVYHNFADIDDYQHFANRVVKNNSAKLQPWGVSLNAQMALPVSAAARLKEIKTTALLVIQNQKIVFEKYDHDGGENVLSGSFSMAKSIVGLLVGFAIQEKAILSVDQAMIDFLPELRERPEGKITIKNLLTMSSGLNWNESYFNPLSITAEAYYGEDLYHTALKQRLVNAPGSVHDYQSGSSLLLGMIVSRAVKKTLSDYASEKLWIPLGAEHEALWSVDHQASDESGLEKAYCCFNATARDFARLGQLVLQKGQWNGVQLLNADYISAMTSPHHIQDTHGDATDYYGYQWWVEQTTQGPVAYARGILGQYIIVIPQKNAVIVRLGHKKGNRVGHTYEEVRMLIDWALNDFKANF